MDTLYSSNDLAEKLGVSVSTIRKYEKDYNLDIMRNESNNRVYTDDDLEVFKKIVELKKEGANIHLIRKVLASEGFIDQVPEVLNSVPSSTIESFKADIVKQIADIVLENEKRLKEEFQKELDEKLQEQERKIKEQVKTENQKLMAYMQESRDDKKGFWRKLFGK
ncbi:MAG: MerR family transcriptional regulator [Marinisporobacter sp.]|nr:MerR family transcriptional regulator [Marinisporobacter sp.]